MHSSMSGNGAPATRPHSGRYPASLLLVFGLYDELQLDLFLITSSLLEVLLQPVELCPYSRVQSRLSSKLIGCPY